MVTSPAIAAHRRAKAHEKPRGAREYRRAVSRKLAKKMTKARKRPKWDPLVNVGGATELDILRTNSRVRIEHVSEENFVEGMLELTEKPIIGGR